MVTVPLGLYKFIFGIKIMEKEMKKENKARREFLKKAGVMLGAGLTVTSLSSLIVSCEKDEILPPPPPGSNVTIKLSDYPSLLNVGGIVKVSVSVPTNLMFIIKREGEKEFLIFEALCPHQGEELIPDPDKTGKKIFCPRHTVDFSAEKSNKGSVINNPQGVRVGSLKSDYNYEFDDVSNTLKILL